MNTDVSGDYTLQMVMVTDQRPDVTATRGWRRSPLAAGVVLVLLVAGGVYLRCAHLGGKVYWHDEALTSLWLSGRSLADLHRQLDGRSTVFATLHDFQRPDPATTSADVVATLALFDTQQVPLHVLLARWWVMWLGDTVATLRWQSVLLSVLAFPLLYWLTRQLFDSVRSAWIAVAFLALSPFHVLYAQEARPYSLWTDAILLASATLLWAQRVNTATAWSIYAASLVLGLYTQLFFAFVVAGHVLYVLATTRFHRQRLRPGVVWATGAAVLAFSPWLFVFLWRWEAHVPQSRWMTVSLGPAVWIREVMLNISLTWFDGRIWDGAGYLALPICLLVLYALWTLPAISRPNAWLFVYALIVPTLVTLVLLDAVFGGQRFAVARYALPCWIGAHLAVAQLCADRTARGDGRASVWYGVVVVLLIAGLVSSTIDALADTGWHKPVGRYNYEVMRLVERSPRPLVASDDAVSLLSLSHTIGPDVAVLILPHGSAAPIPDGYSDVFLLNPSPQLLAALEQEAEWSPTVSDRKAKLWRLLPARD